MAGRGGLRSTSFRKGQSGNPGGMPKRTTEQAKIWSDVKEAAKAVTQEAIDTLVETMRAGNAPYAAKVSAAMALLDRGWGKAKESVDITHKTTLEDLVLASYRPREDDEKVEDRPN